MSLNQTPSAERLHIAFFGLRNAGKSSLVNAVTGQNLSVVSNTLGTTTDPVKKTMELLPIGPVMIIDTPGFDDSGDLGKKRVEKTFEILAKTDVAVMVVDAKVGVTDKDKELIAILEQRKTPFVVAFNKSDLLRQKSKLPENSIYVSAKLQENIFELKEKIAAIGSQKKNDRRIVGDLINKGDTVLLVTPIDESAPKGRLILPQQLTIRDILDSNASVIVCQETELVDTLENLKVPPCLVITDSQVFGTVSKLLPSGIPLTSFSILFARYKGDLGALVKGALKIKSLKDGDNVLISEGCTHHRQCNDIGTVKMPRWIKEFTGKNLNFRFTSGGEFPQDLSDINLVVHCGGCMLNEAEMKRRIKASQESSVEIVNYGVAIALMNGILEKSLQPLGEFDEILNQISS